MSFTDAPDGLLLVEFFDVGDKDRVLIGRPWSFERCLLLVTSLEGDVQSSKLDMNLVPFWVQIHDLPLLYMNREVGEHVGGILGSVLLVDTDENGVGWGKSLRVRVQLDVSQPLLRGKKIRLNGQSLWIYFKYERLPMFCYWCGRLWHGGGGCPITASSKGKFLETVQYGPWLCAVDDNSSSRRGAPSKATVSRVNFASLGDAAEHTVEHTVERTEEMGGKEIVLRQFLHDQSSPSSCPVIDGEAVVRDQIMRESYEDKRHQVRSLTLDEESLVEVSVLQGDGPLLSKVGLEHSIGPRALDNNLQVVYPTQQITEIENKLLVEATNSGPILINSNSNNVPVEMLGPISDKDKGESSKVPVFSSKNSKRSTDSIKRKSAKVSAAALGTRVRGIGGKKQSGFKRTPVLKVTSFPKKLCVRKDVIEDLVDLSAEVAG